MPWISREELQRLRQRASQADNLNDSLSSIQQSLQNLHHQYHDLKGTLMASLADIKQALDDQSTKLDNLATRIEQQANSGAPDPAALQAIADELKAHNDKIDALDVPLEPATPAAAQSAVQPANPSGT